MSEPACKLSEQLHYGLATRAIEVPRWFVREEYERPTSHGSRDRQRLPVQQRGLDWDM